ncbi:flagellar protein FlaG [Reinekea sp.]|jgi:flagellar protein FlaG|uniref:flagellar protein FlaG n=1 Tax=Reinekea sp. TaxID=1970455 RepID=UPI002A80DE21|nr:flagellar protein FlaG [Reinekea sp.]
MNEISLQPTLTAKTSATGQNGSETNAKIKSPLLTEVSQTDTEKADKAAADKSSKTDEQSSQARLNKAVTQLNDYVQSTERKLEFQVDNDSGQTVVKVYDKISEELIRQIPNEEALTLAQRLNQDEPLMLFSAQV